MDQDWEREVDLRLQRLEVDGDRKRERLTELHTETLGQQDRLLDTVRDMQGWKWDDVMDARAQLQEQIHPPANTADTERPERLRSPRSTRGVPLRPGAAVAEVTQPPANPRQVGSSMRCLNSQSPSGSSSTNFSLDRGRAELDIGERQLMRDVRELRLKLARGGRGEGASGEARGGANNEAWAGRGGASASSHPVWSPSPISQ